MALRVLAPEFSTLVIISPQVRGVTTACAKAAGKKARQSGRGRDTRAGRRRGGGGGGADGDGAVLPRAGGAGQIGAWPTGWEKCIARCGGRCGGMSNR